MSTKNVRTKSTPKEADSVYFLKILLYFILGSIWIKYHGVVVFPIGLLIGIIFTTHDHFAIDRKIEYAVMIISSLVALASGFAVFIAIA